MQGELVSTNDFPSRQALESAAVITFSNEPTERFRLASRQRSLAVDVAICLSCAAALAHALSTPEHWRWWTASGVFFALLAIAQTSLAIGLLRKPVRDRMLLAGVWGTVGAISVYVISRTTGIPFAPPLPAHGARWVPGRSIVPDAGNYVGAFDVFTLTVEVLLVILLTGLMTRALRQRTAAHLMWVGLALWALAGLSVL
jgi:hypothetical protein